MTKYFNINSSGCSVRCKMYGRQPDSIAQTVLYGHGFGGHKENKAAERFADSYLAKHKNAAVIVFDWPCHGEDAKKKLSLDDCDTYLRLVIEYVWEQLGAKDLFAYATSFGGYLFLRYIRKYGSPFRKLALRCPAVNMAAVLRSGIMAPEDEKKLSRGKDILVGFDRKIKISPEFVKSLSASDITILDYTPFCNDILILHGTKDELVPFDVVRLFAETNMIEFVPVEGADHRFLDQTKMYYAINRIIDFFDPASATMEQQNTSAKIIRKRIILSGKVQHVGLRWRLLAAADQTGATGWVRNNSDGSVTLEIQGTEEQIDQVFQMISRVESIQIKNMVENAIPVILHENSITARGSER